MHKKDKTTTKLCIINCHRKHDHGWHGSGLFLFKYQYISKWRSQVYKERPKILKIHIQRLID